MKAASHARCRTVTTAIIVMADELDALAPDDMQHAGEDDVD